MIRSTLSAIILSLFTLLFGCSENEKEPTTSNTAVKRFSLLPSSQTSINFSNAIYEKEGENFLLNDIMYNGSGVALGDINNDGLLDILFCGNQVADRLYLNMGEMKFKDITSTAGISDDGTWSTGATFADVNQDGFLDLYISKHFYRDDNKRKNKLYINAGNNTFTDQAEELGLADAGYSVQANFFDSDGDGDLDVYVANQPPAWRVLKGKENVGLTIYSDHLYENVNGKYKQVTAQSGIANYMYSLNVNSSDLDLDGDVDLYIPADYYEADAHYINNGKGVFKNAVLESMRHLSTFGMGSDVADLNNDGWLDLFTADMVAEDNYRNKTNMSGMNPEKFWRLAAQGKHLQYMFNSMQLNNGDGTFSEIAQLTGTAMTDWSWSPLIADLDNDGLKDLTVTNGLYRDIRNKDYHAERNKYVEKKDGKNMLSSETKMMPLIEIAPSVRIENYAYKNTGDLNFKKVAGEWGLGFAGWSHGSAYGDLDNDGDLDIVMNNMNDVAHVYENNSEKLGNANFIRFKLLDSKGQSSRHSRVEIRYADGRFQLGELSPVRGYMSQSEDLIHFGLGSASKIDQVIITWPSGRQTELVDVAANQTLEVQMEEGEKAAPRTKGNTLFSKDKDLLVVHEHSENVYDDYKDEVLLPHRMSHLGPHVSTADINNDGLDDFFVGGPIGSTDKLYVSNGNKYTLQPGPWVKHSGQEALGSCFFDLDGDNDLDLYVTNGGNENPSESEFHQDRLYVNNNGTFVEKSLPEIRTSNGCVTAADIDGDGDMDLFVGGRQMPGKYPYPTSSYLLRNDDGNLVLATNELADGLKNIGMVSDAVWSDFDKDGDNDLILVGEWMPITVFRNDSGVFSNVTESLGLSHTTGWWNTLHKADMDGDGDTDLIVGNLGLNIKYKASTEEPFKVYSYDFDQNGTNDIVLSYYEKGKCFPVRGKQCSSQQMPFIKNKFPTYHEFAQATVDQIYRENIDKALTLEAKNFASLYLENTGGGFKTSSLPVEAQFSTVQGIVTHDVNDDGNLDIVIAGNFHHREVETTRSDASIGYVMLGNGKGEFTTVHPSKSGLKLYQDLRDLKLINTSTGYKLLGAVNGGPMQFYTLN